MELSKENVDQTLVTKFYGYFLKLHQGRLQLEIVESK